MALTDQQIAVRFPHAHLVQRSKATTLYAPMYLGGALVEPTADPVLTLTDADGTVLVDAAAGTVAGSISQYQVGAGLTASLPLEEGWLAEWALTHAGGTIDVVNTAHLVRRRLHPMIGDVDLFEECPAIDPSLGAPLTTYTDFQRFRDAAWRAIQRWLIKKGQRPWLVLEPGGLANAHTYRSLEGVFRDLVQRDSNPDFRAEAERYHDLYQAELRSLALVYDTDDDNRPDRDADGRLERRPTPPVFLMSRS